ncbi:hypothetical protein C4D60_Mb11t22500 [Musa balbisiana]|uniref:Uncharacterized protein n=1 Tax=Musa balbisiana TaxID=52838 RepID=A0A4S8J620_MUSBA|nr:hypothetical protein C4D60_Mb11t22500 [Musa balbisiana]
MRRKKASPGETKEKFFNDTEKLRGWGVLTSHVARSEKWDIVLLMLTRDDSKALLISKAAKNYDVSRTASCLLACFCSFYVERWTRFREEDVAKAALPKQDGHLFLGVFAQVLSNSTATLVLC